LLLIKKVSRVMKTENIYDKYIYVCFMFYIFKNVTWNTLYIVTQFDDPINNESLIKLTPQSLSQWVASLIPLNT